MPKMLLLANGVGNGHVQQPVVMGTSNLARVAHLNWSYKYENQLFPDFFIYVYITHTYILIKKLNALHNCPHQWVLVQKPPRASM